MSSTSSKWNPIAFRPWPVGTFILVVYAALFSVLITFHNVVPKAPDTATPYTGINLTEAWHDLEILTNGYHPYNSHRNDQVRSWLLSKIASIIHRNDALRSMGPTDDPATVVFDDKSSNLTFGSFDSAITVAFAGSNIIVYIRGTDDEPGEFWKAAAPPKKGGVLVNAHFDSVSSGFGATDDGVGVITVLQLISYFTSPQNTPKRGLVALLNNGEEDYLNGAYAFGQHPISKFPHTFLNLEGAGAGGRAVLFRSTDTQVTRFYKKAPNPFGTVISADGFKAKLVRSQTDYVVFNGIYGMRGLDVAFMDPRSRYHTSEDSARYTSKDSLWHMLSGALATVKGLTSDTSSEFDGPSSGPGKVDSGTGSDSVWYDLFGLAFVIFELHTLFAVSVTLLVVTPLLLIALTVILVSADKFYPFSAVKTLDETDEGVRIKGWNGFFRTPIVLGLSTAAIAALAFLLMKFNPHIIYSSDYSVWAMLLSAWFCVSWFLLRGSDAMRPSALQRFYSLLWIYVFTWIILVGVTVLENNFGLAGGYFMVFYFAAVFLALLISYLELFALPTKKSYAEIVAGYDSSSVDNRPTSSNDRVDEVDGNENDNDNDDTNERTSLLREERRTFGSGYGTYNRSSNSLAGNDSDVYQSLPRPYKKEQAWSGYLPSWTWFIQFLILVPFSVILCGQIALLQSTALHQTPADGSSVLTIYGFIVLLSVLLFLPIIPFIHRLGLFLPTILFLIFAGTLVYNILAFPFSDSARLKVYFVQTVNLDTGVNNVSLTGLPGYVDQIIGQIPSASGQSYACNSPEYTARNGLQSCTWHGLPPKVLHGTPRKYQNITSLMTFSATRDNSTLNTAYFHISGLNTRACRILFDYPVSAIHVTNYSEDTNIPPIGPKGSRSVRLWSREWDAIWDVKVSWKGAEQFSGKAVCLWSDANDPKTIPAYEEIQRFMPRWGTITKLSDGLVEVYRNWEI